MKLFRKKDKKKSCCCGGNYKAEDMKKAEIKQEKGIKILGIGCVKCNDLERAVKSAATDLGLVINIEHITDFAQISSYGVMSTPALVVNGKVVSCGRILSAKEIKDILNKI